MSGEQNASRMIRQQLDMSREESTQQSAQSMAQEVAMQDYVERDKEGYWEVITDSDVGRGDSDELPEFIATETSGMLALGNITRQNWESGQWRLENQFDTIHNELLDKDTDIDEIDAATMYGRARPPGTDEAYRRLRGSELAAKQMYSLSINAQGLRSGTEIHAVSKSEKINEEEDSGYLSRLKRKLV